MTTKYKVWVTIEEIRNEGDVNETYNDVSLSQCLWGHLTHSKTQMSVSWL